MTLFLILSIGIGTFYGYYYARNADYFYTLNTPEPQVVLKIYDSKIISAPFDAKTRTVQKEFYIHTAGDEPQLSLSYKQTGPLLPVEP